MAVADGDLRQDGERHARRDQHRHPCQGHREEHRHKHQLRRHGGARSDLELDAEGQSVGDHERHDDRDSGMPAGIGDKGQ